MGNPNLSKTVLLGLTEVTYILRRHLSPDSYCKLNCDLTGEIRQKLSNGSERVVFKFNDDRELSKYLDTLRSRPLLPENDKIVYAPLVQDLLSDNWTTEFAKGTEFLINGFPYKIMKIDDSKEDLGYERKVWVESLHLFNVLTIEDIRFCDLYQPEKRRISVHVIRA